MLGLKSKNQLAQEAATLAKGNELVCFRSQLYMPTDAETGVNDYPPTPDRCVWVPMNRADVQQKAADEFSTLFASDSELRSFEFMLAQNSIQHRDSPDCMLLRTDQGLRRLTRTGALEPVTGSFVPNALDYVVNEDPAAKQHVFGVIAAWLDSEEEAHSLLHHLATSLAPGYSAVKYVLLLGTGRNGKGTLLKMLLRLFSRNNVSSVTRQDMSEQSPVVPELNGKLLNIIFDGQADYLKDSGTEKTLVAGEPAPIRRLYESTPTIVQTNALFIEALNAEPKSKDKSSALQKRLVRFQFSNVYALDQGFEASLLTEEMLGALLSLLIDHYVTSDELAEKLAPTQKAIELQLDHMFVNSLGLQYLKHVHETDAFGVQSLLDEPLDDLIAGFQSWRVLQNDMSHWAAPDVATLFQSLIHTERRSVRVNGSPRKVRFVTSLGEESSQFINSLKGDDDEPQA